LNEVINKIKNLFVDDDKNENVVLMMTGHKAKGLQNPRVFWLRPDLCPSKMAKQEHEIEQEWHLVYVIKTRAQAEFYIVKPEPDEVKPNRVA
jgi:superfamily I DNA/RNA helicase